ncbi:hypothetical protein EXIGLDRAFT_56638 [Exidia glandulosa HHB12029]|uniref:Uncharacterized protein n=1 Tax=Exidia glandulosa HHB12029 TaxID=1314781 RepID=A0A165I7H1_EXIGL|nr:hypothetical protein EXIGLDRAFT_56638 [Exidia glandulosa HHB12029]
MTAHRNPLHLGPLQGARPPFGCSYRRCEDGVPLLTPTSASADLVRVRFVRASIKLHRGMWSSAASMPGVCEEGCVWGPVLERRRAADCFSTSCIPGRLRPPTRRRLRLRGDFAGSPRLCVAVLHAMDNSREEGRDGAAVVGVSRQPLHSLPPTPTTLSHARCSIRCTTSFAPRARTGPLQARFGELGRKSGIRQIRLHANIDIPPPALALSASGCAFRAYLRRIPSLAWMHRNFLQLQSTNSCGLRSRDLAHAPPNTQDLSLVLGICVSRPISTLRIRINHVANDRLLGPRYAPNAFSRLPIAADTRSIRIPGTLLYYRCSL